MYSLSGYGQMIADRVRMDAYAQALRSAIRPESVVLEIGAGPGVLSVLACQLGARRVFAIESQSIIQVAREVAATNKCADRIEFFEAMSTEVELPVRPTSSSPICAASSLFSSSTFLPSWTPGGGFSRRLG
jgi:type I protein arginine methyltransferase